MKTERIGMNASERLWRARSVVRNWMNFGRRSMITEPSEERRL